MNAAFEKLNADTFAALGESVVYVPASALIQSFECTAIVGRTMIDRETGQAVSDVCECSIQHSELSAAGVVQPVTWAEQRQGDTVEIPGPNSTAETWNVIDSVCDETGVWKLALQKRMRLHR